MVDSRRTQGLHFSRQLRFFDRHILKSQSPQSASLELTKTLGGLEVAKQSSLFSVPGVLESDLAQGSISFQRIYGVVTLQELLFEKSNVDAILFRAGRTLATIHEGLKIPKEQRISAPDFGLTLEVPEIAIHGDFAVLNLLYHGERDELWVVDWATPLWLGEQSTLGPCYLDLGVMIGSMFQHRVFAPGYRTSAESLTRCFLAGYQEESGVALDLREFSRYFDALMTVFLRQRRSQQGWLRFLAYQPSIRRGQRFLRKLSREGSPPSSVASQGGHGSTQDGKVRP